MPIISHVLVPFLLGLPSKQHRKNNKTWISSDVFMFSQKKNVWISSDFSQEIWICLGIFRHLRCLSGALSYRGSKDLSVVGEVADVRLHGGPSAVGGL